LHGREKAKISAVFVKCVDFNTSCVANFPSVIGPNDGAAVGSEDRAAIEPDNGVPYSSLTINIVRTLELYCYHVRLYAQLDCTSYNNIISLEVENGNPTERSRRRKRGRSHPGLTLRTTLTPKVSQTAHLLTNPRQPKGPAYS
jgi:hypothetical protein